MNNKFRLVYQHSIFETSSFFSRGRTPFQQDESGVIDLAGGQMAGSMLAYFSVGVYLCERNFT